MEDTANVALLILRIVVGVSLALHGIAKLRSIAGTSAWFESEGLRPGRFHAWLAGGTELAAGLGVALGLLTPFAALAFVGVMATAGWVGHRKNGYSSASNGWELVFILGTAAAVIALLGPGDLSLDNFVAEQWFGLFWIGSETGRWASFIIAAGGGVLMALMTLLTFYRPSAAKQESQDD